MSSRRADAIVAIALVIAAATYMMRARVWDVQPAEDAAILMRYAENVSQGHGVVWNVGEPPVDGATDFLFMIMVAALHALGLSLELSVRAPGMLAHLFTVGGAYWIARRQFHVRTELALLIGVILLLGPGANYVASYFGTTVFAAMALLCFGLSRPSVTQGPARRWAFPLSSLLLGLIRPEGVFLATFVLLGAVCEYGWRATRIMVRDFVVCMGGLGGIYFVWRWIYFGQPLPNPFYKKGGGRVFIENLQPNLLSVGDMSSFMLYLLIGCLVFLLVRSYASYLVSLVPMRLRPARWQFRTLRVPWRQAVSRCVPVIGFIVLWCFLSDEMNYLNRFQYPIVSIFLIGSAELVGSVLGGVQLRRAGVLMLGGLALFLCVQTLLEHHAHYAKAHYYHDSRLDLGRFLSQFKDKKYTMVVTEAGLLPLYSRWRTLDAWGLNDQWIAHHGTITAEYLDRANPELIMFHDYFSPAAPLPASVMPKPDDRSWRNMVVTLLRFAESRGYVLAAAFGRSQFNSHYYFVRADFPDSRAIVDGIRGTRYVWFSTGEMAENWAR